MKSLREADGDLAQNWYIACLSRELKAGQKLARTVYDVPYVLFRDEAGAPAALLDQCPHRGTRLSAGQVVDGQLRCPYHGWTFNGQGRLTDVPSEGELSPHLQRLNEKRNWCVPRPRTVEQDGCIWIWTGQPERASEAPPWRFPNVGARAWTQYFMITDFDNEVTHLVQNFMDVPHTVFVHSKWFRDRKMIRVPMRLDVGEARVKATYFKPKDKIGALGWLLNPDGDEMIHTDEFVFPNLTRVDYGFGQNGFIINSQCTPITRYKTRVYTWIAYKGKWWSRFTKPLMQYYTRRVIEQDVEIMKNHGDNLQRFQEVVPNRSTMADELHLAIEDLRRRGITACSDARKPAFTREREFWI